MKKAIASLSFVCTLIVTSVLSSFAQNPTNCDTFYLGVFTTPALYSSQGGGYIIGNNFYGDKAKAQNFPVTTPKQISEVSVWFGAKLYTSGNSGSSVTLNIYDMDGTGTSTAGTVAAPSTILSTSTIFVDDIDTINQDLMYITLPNPITVTDDYAVGIDLTGLSAGDTVGIISTPDGYQYAPEMSWEMDAVNAWTTIMASWNIDVDIAIFPVECDADVDTTCSVNFILYPDTTLPHHWYAELSSTGSPIQDYLWDWGDGSTSSTGPYPAHTYDSAGYYTICVYTTNANGCYASYCDSSTYIYKTDASMVSVSVIAGSTGIEETAANTFTLYPNPATNTLTLNTDLKNTQLTILNAQGQLVYQSAITNPQSAIDVSQLSPGIYFLSLTNGTDVVSKKFVKQ